MSDEEKVGLLSVSLNKASRNEEAKKKSYGSVQFSSSVMMFSDEQGRLKVRHGDHEDFVVRKGDKLELQQVCEKGCCIETHGKIVEEVDRVTGNVRWRIIDYALAQRSPTVSRIVNKFTFCTKSSSPRRRTSLNQKNATVIDIQDGGEEKCVLYVDGICCASEVAVVQGLLEPIPGVKKVNTNAILRETKVTFDSSLVSSKELVDKLNEASLDARVKKTTEKLYDSIDGDEQRVRTSNDDDDENTESSGTNLPKWNVLLAFVLWALSMIHYAASFLTRKLSRVESELPPSRLEMYLMNLQYLAVVSVVLALPPIAIRALSSASRFTFDVNILMTIAVIGSLGLQKYDEAAAVVVLFSLSDWLEMNASSRARSAIQAIVALRPDTAVLEKTGEVVDVEDVSVGTLVAVRPGDRIPIDGVVRKGESSVDESNLTGESRPITKKRGDDVSAGTINVGRGYLVVETTELSENSAVARLVDLVNQAQSERSPTEKYVERVAKIYTPCVILIALAAATIPWTYGREVGQQWLFFSLDMLIVACPCALIISTPITYVAALAQAARRGILIKGGLYLESLGSIDVIAFDKTGTLTEGEFRVAHVKILKNQNDRTRLLRMLHAVEKCSNHPFAVAACKLVESEISAKSTRKAEDFEILEGEGVRARVGQSEIVIANRRVFKRMFKSDQDAIDIVGRDIISEAESWESQDGATVVWMFENNKPVALFGATDLPRKEASEAVSLLKKMNVKTVMLTGDNDGAARVIQRVVGVSERRSKLLPRQKVDAVREIKYSSSLVGKELRMVMVGDGVNDAPALALADVGIAMGVSGTVVAMETADVALMDNDLRKIPEVIALGRSVVSKIRQNVTISLASKLLVVGLALAGYVYLWLAIAVDVGGMLLVTLNGLTLLSSDERKKKKCCESGDGCEKQTKKKKSGCEKEEKRKKKCCESGDGCEKEEKRKEDMCCGDGCEREEKRKKKKCCESGDGCEKEEKRKEDMCCGDGCEKEEMRKEDMCCGDGCEKEEKRKKGTCCEDGREKVLEKKDTCCEGGSEKVVEKKDTCCGDGCEKVVEKKDTCSGDGHEKVVEKKGVCCESGHGCEKKRKRKKRKKKKKKNSSN